MKYSKAYYQLKAIIKVCKRLHAKSAHKDYLEALMVECEQGISDIEMQYDDDSVNTYTGEVEELELEDIA